MLKDEIQQCIRYQEARIRWLQKMRIASFGLPAAAICMAWQDPPSITAAAIVIFPPAIWMLTRKLGNHEALSWHLKGIERHLGVGNPELDRQLYSRARLCEPPVKELLYRLCGEDRKIPAWRRAMANLLSQEAYAGKLGKLEKLEN